MVFTALSCLGQVKVDYNGGAPQYQKVIEVEGKTAADLYKACNKWVAVTYKNAAAVVAAQVENEMIKGNGASVNGVKIGALVYATLDYSFTIDIKDGKVRYTANPGRVGDYLFSTYVFKNDGSIRGNSQAQNILTSVDGIINGLISSLESHFSKPKDDW